MIKLLPVDTAYQSKENTLLYRASKLADESDFILGNTAMYTFSGDQLLVLLDENEKMVGMIQYYIKKKKPEVTLHRICVQELERRKGYASFLLHAMLIDVKRQGVLVVRLKCPVGIEANDFYKRSGFTLIEQVSARTGRELNVWERSLS